MKKNLFYAQSGGVTAVINATACGVIQTARRYGHQIGNVLAGKNGILGALNEELIDTSKESDEAIEALKHTPGGAFGSCRYKLQDFKNNRSEYERLIEVFSAHNIGYFLYNGGGDSQDTAYKVSQLSHELGYPLVCIGIPKTIDNDLPLTDTCPGFGSVAKYIAISTMEAGLDVASMATSSTKVFILEVMGRHTGWIAASSALAQQKEGDPPHLILFPEVPWDETVFLTEVDRCVKSYGYCVVVASEGLRTPEGRFLSDTGAQDAFGHAQLGGVASFLARTISHTLGYKYHYAIADYLQRSARHIASLTDLNQAYALGQAAVEEAIKGTSEVMLTLVRESIVPSYRWSIGQAPLMEVANVERTLPNAYIDPRGFAITEACRRYLKPLIEGEAYPPYKKGLPCYEKLKCSLAKQKLNEFSFT